MRRISVVVVTSIFLLFFQFRVDAQEREGGFDLNVIEPVPLELSYDRTTHIIFPYAIQSVDRGHAGVLAQKAKGVNNVLQLKAGRKDFAPTNISVITADGKFYSFLLYYAVAPSSINFKIDRDLLADTVKHPLIQLSHVSLGQDGLEATARELLKQRAFLQVSAREQKMRATLTSIYLKYDLLWFTFRLKNQSLIPYTPGEVRFFVQDRKRSKRTAVQEREIFPVFHSSPSTVRGDSCTFFVFAFAPFTILNSQVISLQISEKNGGRRLSLRIKPRTLLRARLLH